MNNNSKTEYLIRYTNYYLTKKNIKMKGVLRSILQRLQTGNKITLKQFNCILKFLIKEKDFKTQNKSEITLFFSHLIKGYQVELKYERPPSLEDFMLEV